MAHKSTKTLLAECDGATTEAIAQFRIAQLAYLSALGTLMEKVGVLQRKTDEAEDDERHAGCLQRIEGVERQAHAVQMHSDKARIAVRNMRGAVNELETVIEELRGQVQKKPPQDGRASDDDAPGGRVV